MSTGAEMLTPDGFRKEQFGSRETTTGRPGEPGYGFSSEYTYVLVCKECGGLVWDDEKAATAHRRMHQALRPLPMGKSGVRGG